MDVAKTHQDQLARIKENVRKSYDYFKPNYDRFNEFRRFVFESSLTNDDIALLTTIGKPQLEFNVLEAYVSRLMGEFSKQEPSIEVSADDQDRVDPVTIHVVEQNLRHFLFDSKNYHTKYEVYKDLISGGFSTFKIGTEYANPMSFNQVITFDRVYDPTLCGWDQTAKYSHKGDGRFCFELFPKEEEEFKEEFPDVDIKKISFNRAFGEFNWAYSAGNTKIIIVADYYEKKKKRVKIVQLADNRVITYDDYKKMIDEWADITQPPAIKGKPRFTEMETIVRYRLIDNQVLSYEETDFPYFPLVFVDGNSIMVKTNKNGNVHQLTRPYVYHAKGAQRLKNYAGVSLANEIENMVQHKFMVAKEALPKEEDWLEAYKDVQKANVIVFNALFEQDPDKPIPNPIREVQRVPAPPEVVQAFSSSDALIQNILGSYDASLGINNNQLSGIAIVEGATQSNAAAMPYVIGFLQGLQRVAQLYISLLPKYVKTPRTLPVMGIDGKKDYVKVNSPDGVPLFYDENVLNVKVEAGVAFQIQKNRALQQIIALQGQSKLFDQFMNEKGLPVLLDNMEIRGIDQLKSMVDEWLKELQKQKEMAMQQQQQEMQNNPLVQRNMMQAAKLQQDQQKNQQKFMIDMEKLRQAEIKVLADALMAKESNATQLVKAETERFAKKVDLAIKGRDMHHRHMKDKAEFHHKLIQPTKYENRAR